MTPVSHTTAAGLRVLEWRETTMANSLAGEAPVAAHAGSVGRVRWGICALLFFATTINYIDRQMISVLKPTLQDEYGWNETTYANIVFSFQLAYAIGYVVFGRLMDKLGARFGYSLAAAIWAWPPCRTRRRTMRFTS